MALKEWNDEKLKIKDDIFEVILSSSAIPQANHGQL
jgi:hypothetical protein